MIDFHYNECAELTVSVDSLDFYHCGTRGRVSTYTRLPNNVMKYTVNFKCGDGTTRAVTFGSNEIEHCEKEEKK